MSLDYGFTNSDEVQYDRQGLPVGIYKAMITAEEMDAKNQLVVTYEILNGDFKGKTAKSWYCVNHSSAQTANIAKQNIKRIADATGKAVSSSMPLKGRVLVLEVRPQKKDDKYTEIARYLPADHDTTQAPF